MKKSKIEEKESVKVEPQNEIIDLLKELIKQNSQVIELLTKLKERFV